MSWAFAALAALVIVALLLAIDPAVDWAARRFGPRNGARDRTWMKRVLLLVCVGVTVVGSFVALRELPQHLTTVDKLTEKDRASDLSAARTAVLAWLAGGIAFAGAVYTARTFKLAQRGHQTDRFSKAVEQLGHTSVEVRVGAIHALERIQRDSPTDRRAVSEMLATFVRRNASRTPHGDGPALDVHAALAALGRSSFRSRRLVLANTFLADVVLAGLDFSHADLSHAVLARADLTNVNLDHADLRGADLREADLTGATLRDAHTEGCSFDGCVGRPT